MGFWFDPSVSKSIIGFFRTKFSFGDQFGLRISQTNEGRETYSSLLTAKSRLLLHGETHVRVNILLTTSVYPFSRIMKYSYFHYNIGVADSDMG